VRQGSNPAPSNRRWPVLLQEQRGIAATEFGLIAPVFFLLLLGLFDIGHMAYARVVFNGAVEQAARDASLETGDTEEADQMVEDLVRHVLPDIVLETERKSYFDFADIARPEQWTDNKGKSSSGAWVQYPGRDNGKCDHGEPYVDENRSGKWEADIAAAGNGGAGDVVIYTVTATYEPLFRIPFMPESWAQRTLTATAVKKNQPFRDQTEYATTTGTCTV
jgi:hypothetical protein